jgi:glucosyl-dolichyl phosphate glucuronosyltransferase
MRIMKTIRISCVICTYNRERFLHSSIESLANQTLDRELYEVVIVNNNSTDNTDHIAQQLIEKYKENVNFTYVIESKQGLSHARNRGISEAKGEYICYIDDDAIASPDFLKNIVDFFESNPEAAGVGGKIIPEYVDGKPEWMNHFMEGLVSKVDNGEKIFEYNGSKFPIGCNMTYKKSILLEIGMFDPDLGRKGNSGEASEEKDVFFKIFNKGYKVFYLPDIPVKHIIESARLEYPYIQKISAGIGRSERLRVAKLGKIKLLVKFAELIFKFGAALLIALYYSLKLQFSKAKAVVVFRIDVFRGWFSV